jgi:hypothetical protein
LAIGVGTGSRNLTYTLRRSVKQLQQAVADAASDRARAMALIA